MSSLSPPRDGLYRPGFEHDACGVGFVCAISGQGSHQMLTDGAKILANLEHRGATGANPSSGDGAGMLIQIPDQLYRAECARAGYSLPRAGSYVVAMVFLPQSDSLRERAEKLLEDCLRAAGLELLGWRDPPCDNKHLNNHVRSSEPVVRQIFAAGPSPETIERKAYLARRIFEIQARKDRLDDDPAGLYVLSLSSRTVVYKGMFLANQLRPYYGDLCDQRATSALALVHQRFSTNTFPAWALAHPYRILCHNGEINTIRGNVNNMLARQGNMASEELGADLAKIFPLLDRDLSDSGTIDNALDLLLACGWPLAQAITTLIPEAWQGHKLMNEEQRAYYMHHATMMEPWDGPALVAFTDGRQIGALLDRNGLRPARYTETTDGRLIMSSEAGVLPLPDELIARKWRLEPGRILLIDLDQGRVVTNDQVKDNLAQARPFQGWVRAHQIPFASLPDCVGSSDEPPPDPEKLLRAQQSFGYSDEDIKFILTPMTVDAQESVGAMGDDTPIAVLANRARSLSSYFRQEFAQVTNPAIDPIREDLVMATNSYLGRRPNLLTCNSEPTTKVLALDTPILRQDEFDRLRRVSETTDGNLVAHAIDITYQLSAGPEALEPTLREICTKAEEQVRDNASILILSDRAAGPERLAVPALLAVSAVHQCLIRAGTRTHVGLVVDTGAARTTHDFAVLAGFGAEAFCPYLAFLTINQLRLFGKDLAPDDRCRNYCRAIDKGLRKVMSKMGVSTFQSFCGAQLFEAIGLGEELISKYFTNTISQIGGIGIAEIARESRMWHDQAYGHGHNRILDCGGEFAYRERGERHLWNPASLSKLQHAVRTNQADSYDAYATLINNQARAPMTLRSMLRIREQSEPIALAEVEAVAAIVRRFATGAMSFGSISQEAHTTLAIAMNRIGGQSNTGEGGEDPKRYQLLANGDSQRSAIKQIASGRFGVTIEYLANSDMMQIKIAQGAKPGEGGQLPGYKVDYNIARIRHSVPGVGLISPPPHHDIYSIEDIAQLIHDLKNANPAGKVSVKLVSRYGVGTVAAGVAKARSDHITIAGHDGGTGASPLSSIKHAGTPWELGLAETNQTLVLNDLRSRVRLQVDGQIKTGRDVIIGALLGADEFGFATAPLVASGCVMMRKCHLNTCPVGIATQDPRLRRKFAGTPEHVVNYFFFVAEEVRALMAKMGFRNFDEMIGRCDLLEYEPPKGHWKAGHLDLGPVLKQPSAPPEHGRYHCQHQKHGVEDNLDAKLRPQIEAVVRRQTERIELDLAIANGNRSFGTQLSGLIAQVHGQDGLPDESVVLRLTGSAGQSFGAFLAHGVTLDLIGETNDYCAKGLSGGIIAVHPPASSRPDGANIIAGNTCLYGAIAGECYFRGVVGERFCVRNSGATAVVEGAGDHCCEYMTGGTTVVLGPVGRNFAAGMSGGVAYVYDEAGSFASYCNQAMVDIEELSAEAGPDTHLQSSDTEILRNYLARHYSRTRSPKAAGILKDWNNSLAKFVKIMPREYRRALSEMADQEESAAIAAQA